MYTPHLFIHWWTLVLLPLLAMMNSASMNMGVQILKTLLSILFDIHVEVLSLDHMVIPFLLFWGMAILFSTVSVPFYTPTNNFVFIFTNICYFLLFFDSSFSNMYEVIAYCGFELNFPWIVMLNVFSYACLWFLYIFLEKCLFKSFAHFLIGLFGYFCMFVLSCMGSLYSLDTNPLSRYMVCRYFLKIWRLPCHSIDCVFWCTKVLNFDVVQFIYFYFFWLFFFVMSDPRNHCQIQCNEAFPLCFHLRVL